MRWTTRGYVLRLRRFGESHAILWALTEHHGRHAGLVRGAFAKRMRGVLERGNLVTLQWSARLEEHLGLYVAEMDRAHALELMESALGLSALDALIAMTEMLPERMPHPNLFLLFGETLQSLNDPSCLPRQMVRYEYELLRELGYGVEMEERAAAQIRAAMESPSPSDSLKALPVLRELFTERVCKVAGKPFPKARLHLEAQLKSAILPR